MMPPIVILAGGYAKRLQPITKTIPKSMVEVAGKPFIAHQLALVKRNGFKKVIICSGHLSEQIEGFVGNGKKYGLSVNYSIEGRKLLGTGGALKKALPLLTDYFAVMYGDSYLDIDFKRIIDCFSAHNEQGLMTILKNTNKWDQSNVVCKNGEIIKYDKEINDPKMKYIDYGLGILRKSAFTGLTQKKVFDLVAVYQSLINKKQLLAYEIRKRFYEIGSHAGLAETEEYLLNLSRHK